MRRSRSHNSFFLCSKFRCWRFIPFEFRIIKIDRWSIISINFYFFKSSSVSFLKMISYIKSMWSFFFIISVVSPKILFSYFGLFFNLSFFCFIRGVFSGGSTPIHLRRFSLLFTDAPLKYLISSTF